jgi:hypothetical protein
MGWTVLLSGGESASWPAGMDSHTASSGIDTYQMLISLDFDFFAYQHIGYGVKGIFHLDMTIGMDSACANLK